ncbi:MAG TPA: hypothetical protein VK846_19435 [Candidatus Limnocylindria bacterium]|nr:hypothetical protein [Candidatus Limnocylindria bacterium]
MRFVRQYRFVLLFFLLLIFCSVMVLRQIGLKQSKHVEIREALILLQTRNETNEARRLFDKLVMEVPQYTGKLSNKQLLDDFQRTLLLVDPYSTQTNNLIWRYHWTVSNELDRRAESSLERARKLAREE